MGLQFAADPGSDQTGETSQFVRLKQWSVFAGASSRRPAPCLSETSKGFADIPRIAAGRVAHLPLPGVVA
jgi:hypothetical protein